MGIEVFETGAAESFGKARSSLSSGDAAALEGAFDHVANRGLRLESGILLYAGQASALAERDFASVGFDFACQNPEQSGFARAVRADQANAISFRNGEGNFLEERVRCEGFRNFLCVDNRRQRLGI